MNVPSLCKTTQPCVRLQITTLIHLSALLGLLVLEFHVHAVAAINFHIFVQHKSIFTFFCSVIFDNLLTRFYFEFNWVLLLLSPCFFKLLLTSFSFNTWKRQADTSLRSLSLILLWTLGETCLICSIFTQNTWSFHLVLIGLCAFLSPRALLTLTNTLQRFYLVN